jgi:UDP-N-acetylglucosamine 2-epimerase
MAPVIRELDRHPDCVHSLVCSTGQHREMLDQVLGLFGIHSDFDLGLMRPNQSLSTLTAALFEALERVVTESRPDWILAQGDTTTVMVAGLVSFYHRIRFGHVEAGLRTGDMRHPFPEELNRRVADMVAEAYFAPTEGARQALIGEGVSDGRIFVTGNTGIDALLDVASRPFDWTQTPLADRTWKRLVLITAHRRENFGRSLEAICGSISELAARYAGAGMLFVYPVHLNPNVRRPVTQMLGGLPNVLLCDPLDYSCLVHVMKQATLILTDSGGIQEEAPSFGVPVLVLRDKTERPEAVEAGLARLVGTSRDRIVTEASMLLDGARPVRAGDG